VITFDEAAVLIAGIARPLGTETVALCEARGRVLATPVLAGRASPSSAVSAMDGYAVRDADLALTPASLPVAGESFAGAGFAGPLPAGGCIRIFTGAPVPNGADRVVIQEEVRREGDLAGFDHAPCGRRHIRPSGSDFQAGDLLVPPGRRLNAQRMVAAAAANLAILDVYRRPTVAILATGDELAAPGTPGLRPDATPESVSFGVAALAEDWGAEVVSRRLCGDDLSNLQAAAALAVAEADVVVVTGGASVGERDFAREMFSPLGLDLLFSKVAIKPGKPVWVGRAGGAIIVGLPGNPTSALVTARLFMAPLIAGLAGRDPAALLSWRDRTLAAPLKSCGDRETFERGRLVGGGVAGLAVQDSATQMALATADVLIRRRAGAPALSPGDSALVLDF